MPMPLTLALSPRYAGRGDRTPRPAQRGEVDARSASGERVGCATEGIENLGPHDEQPKIGSAL